MLVMLGIVVSGHLLAFDNTLCYTRALSFSSSFLANTLFLRFELQLATLQFFALSFFLTLSLLRLSTTLGLQLFATLFLLLLQFLLFHLLHGTRRQPQRAGFAFFWANWRFAVRRFLLSKQTPSATIFDL